MKKETKNKLLTAWQYCDDNDKSTEFMLQYMQDFANVDLDCVINFIQATAIRTICGASLNKLEKWIGKN